MDALNHDAWQNLLEQADARQRTRAGIHTHRCWSCEEEMTCCCGDRRQVDRLTGKERRLLCLGCIEVRAAVLAGERAKRTGE
jgi:hypothetical protein